MCRGRITAVFGDGGTDAPLGAGPGVGSRSALPSADGLGFLRGVRVRECSAGPGWVGL